MFIARLWETLGFWICIPAIWLFLPQVISLTTPSIGGIDERILYKLLLLQDKLESKGYDRDAIEVRYGHRSPLMNELVNGASQSRHIAGQAVDMVIGDIDKNGKFTDADKQIVIDICEKYIIKNEGGLGLYPGTRTVHMDVRGYRARWNSYKGKFLK